MASTYSEILEKLQNLEYQVELVQKHELALYRQFELYRQAYEHFESEYTKLRKELKNLK